MASTYTSNLGIETPASGDRSNTWGTMVNSNMGILDRVLGGRTTITKASGGANVYGVDYPITLAVSDGALSDGQYPAIEYADDGDLGADLYVQLTPADAKRTITFKNSLTNDRSLVIYQGEYNSGRAYTVPNGYDATLVFSGGGSTAATATRLVEKQSFEELDTTAVAQATRTMLGGIFYPVGSIYISTSATNPGTSMGFGTWARFGEGKTLFSQHSADTAFDVAEETGGSKTISEENLPAHSHDSGTLGGVAESAGNHSHTVSDQYVIQNNSLGGDRGYAGYGGQATTNQTTSTAGAHTHTVNVSSGSTGNTGSGTDYLPPYITVYMWKRTA